MRRMLSVIVLSQVRVSGIVSGMPNGRSFSTLRNPSRSHCPAPAAAGTASGLYSVFVGNGGEHEFANAARSMLRRVTNRLDRTHGVGDNRGVAQIALFEECRDVIRKCMEVVATGRGVGARQR
jgi:hypothetical protein